MTQIINAPLTPGTPGAPPLGFNATQTSILSGTGAACPYAILQDSPQLSWSGAERTASENYLMRSGDVVGFANQAIGLDIPWPDAPFMMRHKRKMPGNPDLIATRIHARPAEPRPADPMLTDPLVFESTEGFGARYSRHMVVTIEYSTADVIEPGLEDSPSKEKPESFCEVKITTGAEFLNVGQQNTFFIGINTANTNHGGFRYIEEDDGNPNWRDNPAKVAEAPLTDAILAAADPNRGLEIAHSHVIPTREYTVIWRHVFHIPDAAIRNAKGKVNIAAMAIFDNAPAECVLFMGETITEEPLRAPDGRRLYTIEYKFIEKQVRIEETDHSDPVLKILGWNHFWVSGTPNDAQSSGWRRLVTNRTPGPGVADREPTVADNLDLYNRSPYRLFDFSKLFSSEKTDFIGQSPGFAGLVVKRARENTERGNAQINTSN